MSTSFYKQVVPLNRDRHRKLRIRTDGSMTFAARVHFVPLTAIEFYDAARDYPIVFAGGEDAGPLAMLGLRSEENLFVDAEGRWLEGAYVPAFVSRYPFILARPDQTKSDYTVCLDESFEAISETEGVPLFEEDGKETERLTRIVTHLRNLVAETERTRKFVERLRELDLLTVRSIQVQDRGGRVYALRDFRVIDEKKLAEIEGDVLGELHRMGYLGCIYAHLVSLGNIGRLALRVPTDQADAAAASGDS